MKRAYLLLVLLLLAQLAEAKTILYVSNVSTDTPCSALPTLDAPYCNRLVSLGYEVKVINELNARDNTTTWNEYADNSDAIFLGNDHVDMANKNKSADEFCGSITSKNKPLFTAFANNWFSKTGMVGCAFTLGIFTFNSSDNKCSAKAFKVAKAGFITEGLEVDENITIYPTSKAVKIYNTTTEGWITAECVPPNASIDFYPVLYADNRNVFWGFDEPQSFSNITWDIFDRVILNLLNDSVWNITAFILPSTPTVNQNFLVLANVTQNGKPISGIINLTAETLSITMTHDGFWRSNLMLNEARQYGLNITAYSNFLRGSLYLPVNVGSLTINITSGSFKPSTNYLITTAIRGASQANYRILDPFNYTILLSGSLNCGNNTCNGTVESMPDMNSVLLEVTASGESVGGVMKLLNKETLTTDKSVYKPGETMKIDFFSYDSLTNANLTIIRPDGTKETPSPLQMVMVNPTYWTKNYSLGEGSYNGTYIINVKTAKGESNKSVDIVAWNPYAYLDKKTLNVFEVMNLNVGVSEAYSSNLEVNVSSEISMPDGNKTFLGSSNLKGNSIYNFSYLIPRGYPSGLSTIRINFTDSKNRSYTLYLNFSTNITLLQPSLFVTPSFISIITIPKDVIERTITLENTADINATNIIKEISGIDMDADIPTSLAARQRIESVLRIDPRRLNEGSYTGKINLYSQVGDAEVTVSLEILGDLPSDASNKYAELVTLENNITFLSKMWVNTTDAALLLNQAKDTLNESISYYRAGDYETAKAKLEEALDMSNKLETEINNLYGKIPDNSYIIWYFAFAIVIVITTVTAIKVKGRRKKAKAAKKAVKEEPKKEEIFFEPKGGEYRTEYY